MTSSNPTLEEILQAPSKGPPLMSLREFVEHAAPRAARYALLCLSDPKAANQETLDLESSLASLATSARDLLSRIVAATSLAAGARDLLSRIVAATSNDAQEEDAHYRRTAQEILDRLDQELRERMGRVADVGDVADDAYRHRMREAAKVFVQKETETDEPALVELIYQAAVEHMPRLFRAISTWEFKERDGMLSADADLLDFCAKLPGAPLKEVETQRQDSRARWDAHRAVTSLDEIGPPWRDDKEVWRRWVQVERRGESLGVVPGMPRAFFMLCTALWPAVLKLHERQREPVRMSRDTAHTFALARIHGGTANDEHILVEPPKGTTLMLPFNDGVSVSHQRNVVGLRQVIDGSYLRTYMCTLVLYEDAGMRPDGSFEIDGPGDILDVIGAQRHVESRGQRKVTRYHSRDVKRTQEELALFSRIRVRAVGDLEAVEGDPLLDEIRDRRSGRTVTYAHSRLIVGHLQTNYVRIPRDVCRLEAADVPLGMGVALVIRERIVTATRTGKNIEVPVSEVLRLAGINAAEGRRHDGKAFWPKTVDRLAQVVEQGALGKITATGTGENTLVQIDVDARLKEGYDRLVKASKAREKDRRTARVIEAKRPVRTRADNPGPKDGSA